MRSRTTIELQRNYKPQPECLLQNQLLILETMLDVRELLQETLIKLNRKAIGYSIAGPEHGDNDARDDTKVEAL